MNTGVTIKGYKNGIILQLNDTLPFEELLELIRAKFSDSAKFFGDAHMALTFEGRKLSSEEQKQVLGVISETTSLEIICVFDNDEANEALLKHSMEQVIGCLSNMTGQIYQGVIPRGHKLESETSIIIVGNVEAGARILSGGSIIVLGSLNGAAIAGTNFDKESFVYASQFSPSYLKVNQYVYDFESIDEKTKKKQAKLEKKQHLDKCAKIARILDKQISIVSVEEETFGGSKDLEDILKMEE